LLVYSSNRDLSVPPVVQQQCQQEAPTKPIEQVEQAELLPSNTSVQISTPSQGTEDLCIPQIDIVYTWVNGSDPRQIQGSYTFFFFFFVRCLFFSLSFSFSSFNPSFLR
jgi:hypothetical protein